MEQIKQLLTKFNENKNKTTTLTNPYPSQAPLLLATKYKIHNNQEIHTSRNKFHI